MFLYVNSSFAPALDEVVGNLFVVSLVSRNGGGLDGGSLGKTRLILLQCFKDSNDQLIVTYSMTPAFG